MSNSEASESDLSPREKRLEEWRENNEEFQYEGPEGPADAWSGDEWNELADRMVKRRVSWKCEYCSKGPIRSLKEARRHVKKQHSDKLARVYGEPENE